MRRFAPLQRAVIAAVVTAAILVAPAGAAGARPKAKPKRQTVTGTIVLPGSRDPVFPTCDLPEGPLYTITSGRLPNGIAGHVFEVDPQTAGGTFELETAGAADLDIYFFRDGGSASDPTTRPAAIEFATREQGGETGVVPEGFRLALVCIADGQNAAFTYDAKK